jgi:hypothetical protein
MKGQLDHVNMRKQFIPLKGLLPDRAVQIGQMHPKLFREEYFPLCQVLTIPTKLSTDVGGQGQRWHNIC